MKRAFTLLAAGLGLAASASAQLSENFNAGIPATWLRYNVDGLTPASSVSFVNNAWVARAGTPWGTDSCAVSTSWYNPAGIANDWLVSPSFTVPANSFLKWDEYASDAAYPDGYIVYISTTGNTPTSFTTQLYSTAAASSTGWTTRGVSLASYSGQTVRIAFRNNSNDMFLLGIDDVSTTVLSNANAAKTDSVAFPKIVATTTPAQVRAMITNQGSAPITSATLTYAVDGGTPVSQTFTGLNISVFNSAMVTFTTPVSGTSVGAHTLMVKTTQVNGTANPLGAALTEKSVSFITASQSVQRGGLIEEFTSSTCPPCASFNAFFDPMLASKNVNTPTSNINVIKYQMNYPNPGTDASYSSYSNVRHTYYGVQGIPDHFVNGATGTTASTAAITAEVDSSKVRPAFANITGSYVVTNDSLRVNVSVTPYFTMTGNYRLHIAAVERQYLNPGATTSQSNYVYVMRQMFPDAGGTTIASFTNNTAITNSFRKTYAVGNVTQNSMRFWGSPVNSDLIIFVQDNNTKEVLQSKVIPATNALAIANVTAAGSIRIFPNPATDVAVMEVTVDKAATGTVLISDAAGRVVYQTSASLKSGANAIQVPAGNFAAGLYNVTVRTEHGAINERLTVAK